MDKKTIEALDKEILDFLETGKRVDRTDRPVNPAKKWEPTPEELALEEAQGRKRLAERSTRYRPKAD